jgi:hypothetical protein
MADDVQTQAGAPAFSQWSSLSMNLELTQLEASVSGAPGGKIFDRRWHQDSYAELAVLANATGLATVFDHVSVMSTLKRQAKHVAVGGYTYVPTGTPQPPRPASPVYTPHPHGVPAP